jgi:CBS domain-containing protein
MSLEVAVLNRNERLRRAIVLVSETRARRLPVIEGEGRLGGILARADLAVDPAGFDPVREIELEEMIERISGPAHPRRPLPGAPPPNLAHLHSGYIFEPADRGGDVGFRPAGSRGLDEW